MHFFCPVPLIKPRSLLRCRFLGCQAMLPPKETAAHIRTFLSRNRPITASVPFSRTFSRQIRPLKLAQSENAFLPLHPVIGDVTNGHADFRILFRDAEKYLRRLNEPCF